jgi:hypothetical protein
VIGDKADLTDFIECSAESLEPFIHFAALDESDPVVASGRSTPDGQLSTLRSAMAKA